MEHGEARMVLEWRVAPAQAQPVTDALQVVMLATRRETGCLGCTVSTTASDRVTVRYVENWDTEEGLRRQVRSDRFRMLAALVETATESPRIEFVLAGGTRGIDWATELREVR